MAFKIQKNPDKDLAFPMKLELKKPRSPQVRQIRNVEGATLNTRVVGFPGQRKSNSAMRCVPLLQEEKGKINFVGNRPYKWPTKRSRKSRSGLERTSRLLDFLSNSSKYWTISALNLLSKLTRYKKAARRQYRRANFYQSA